MVNWGLDWLHCGGKSMSLYYTHLLVSCSPKYRPEPGTVTAFVDGIIGNRNVAKPFTISSSQVTKGEPNFRELRNTFTGETIKLRMPSRKVGPPRTLASTSEIVERVSGDREYQISIVSEGLPSNRPCLIGHVEGEMWKPMTEAYHQEIRCCVRDHIVRLSMAHTEEELHQPLDLSKWQPILDEDCSDDDREGVFAHPQKTGIRIPNAGCGKFWIEFRYGKFIFPMLKNGGLDLLDDSLVNLARKTFGGDFVQACHWG